MKKVPIEIEAKIVRLFHAEGWPPNTIARQLGVHYCVVRRVLSEQGVPAPKLAPRPSKVDPYVPFIRETLEKYPRLRATRLWHMAKARGFDGGISRFREIVAMHRPRKQPEAFLRLTMLPADQAQVDWAHFGHVTVGKAKRKLMAFVMTLSYSRHTFLRFFHESHTGPRRGFRVLRGRPSSTAVRQSEERRHVASRRCRPMERDLARLRQTLSLRTARCRAVSRQRKRPSRATDPIHPRKFLCRQALARPRASQCRSQTVVHGCRGEASLARRNRRNGRASV